MSQEWPLTSTTKRPPLISAPSSRMTGVGITLRSAETADFYVDQAHPGSVLWQHPLPVDNHVLCTADEGGRPVSQATKLRYGAT